MTMRLISILFLGAVALHMMIRRYQNRIRAFILHGVLLMIAALLVGVYPVAPNKWIAFVALGIVASASQYVFSFHGKF